MIVLCRKNNNGNKHCFIDRLDKSFDIRQDFTFTAGKVGRVIGGQKQHHVRRPGCLFSDTLCERDSEWCFDETTLFIRLSGASLSSHQLRGTSTRNDLQTYDLGSEDLRLLEQEMQRLFMLGYRWSHTYTQCVLQTLLHSISHKTKFDLSTCNGELDQDLEGAIRAIEGEELEQVDPRNLAIVRFTPSATDPHTDFADEVYFPPIREGAAHNGFTPSASGDDGDAHADFADEVYFPPGGESNAINGDREHQESATSEPGASSGPPDRPRPPPPPTRGNGAKGGWGPPCQPSRPPHRPRQRPSPPPENPPGAGHGRHYSYGENDYDDYQSPYHFQSPVSPMMFRKRGMGLPRGNDALYQDAALPSKLAAIFDIRRMRDSRQQAFQPRNQYPTPEERVAFPERLLKNEFGYDDGDEDEDEGVFEEQPVRPAYAQRLQFFGGNEDLLGPSVESNAWSPDRRLEENQRGEGMRNNMPDLLQESLDLQDILRSFRPQMGGGGGPGYPSNAPAFPSMSRNTNFQDYAGIPQERLPEFVLPDPYLPEIPRPRFGLESGPGPEAAFFDRRDDLEEYQLEQLEQEVEKELARESPRTSALREAFGPQLNALDDYGNDYDEYGGLDDYSDYPGGRQMLFGDSPFALQKKDEETLGDDYAELLAGEDLNFQRPEREDVKKPGPPYSVNNFAFKNSDGEEENDRGYEELDDQEPVAEGGDVMLPRLLQEGRALPPEQLDLREVNDLQAAAKLLGPAIQPEEQVPDLLLDDEVLVDKASDDVNVGDPKMARLKAVSEEPMPTQASTETPHYKPISPDTVYINVNRSFESWAEAKKLADLVMREAGLGGDHLGELSKDGGQVTFRIKENGRGITASDVAKKANDQDLREQVKKKLGLEIMGTEAVTKSAMSVPVFSPSENHILAAVAIVCGVMAALLVGATVLFFLRRHAKSRAKLQGLTAHDTEASKDYQDLCRARMAGKTGGEGGKTEPAPTHAQGQRVSSLSRDSDNGNNSPSSRSSTSSCEEPVASNMDISTGHMVLSYMEDHLKNKDRLEQEWIALCAYEAEPCATTLALKPENNKKNRYPDAVPYDHNRVVLNAHANVNGSDYINASSITDHDPRNPAYIATQGPLDATAADFWQLVWEQGSVVIVMLTRLTENGHAFCHRYWPEEGSDLYHIYEVHLVSEHIWCDDYLVRSFYLKNVRTGETRTVTQFHFLSWPDSGTPASTKALLEFRRKVNKSYRGRSCPIIVHCSDGIGRTGTYCLIDMVLNRMAKGAKEIDIAATLEHIRDQRPHMVKSKAQFEFVLMAVAEEVHAILKALPQ
ncbi:uncharacterized protein LOC125040410 [Penaeus chinensis]|uniref:uncharacterized protein LOC125040410 n=1 Tax=Penaeus chinensis TaxID=139456 RepID=UPI001FB80B3B|nr:uncharacterized protein LOC125040410 [Penaeus chinensis]